MHTGIGVITLFCCGYYMYILKSTNETLRRENQYLTNRLLNKSVPPPRYITKPSLYVMSPHRELDITKPSLDILPQHRVPYIIHAVSILPKSHFLAIKSCV